MPHLSICIATLNRAKYLRNALDNIISQITEDVEVVVVDGASTDQTEQVVRKCQTYCSQIRYLRLPINGGFDQDYNHAVELSRGDYCWLMSDDDLLKPNAVATVLRATSDDHDLIIVNYDVWNKNYTQLLIPFVMPISTDRVYLPKDGPKLLIDTADALSYVGSVVIKRRLWLERDKAAYFGTMFVHVGVIFQSSLPNSALVIAQPQVATRYGNASWHERHFEIWMFKWPGLIWSFSTYTDATKRQVTKRKPWRNLELLLRNRAINAFSLNEYYLLLAPRLQSNRERWIMKLIARMPGAILNLAYVAIISLFRLNIDCGFFLLNLKTSPFYFLNWFSSMASLVATQKRQNE